MSNKILAAAVASLSLMSATGANAAVALPSPSINELVQVYDGEYAVMTPRHFIMMYFAGRNGSFQNGQIVSPTITDIDKQLNDALLARYTVEANPEALDDQDPVRPVRMAYDANWGSDFVKRQALTGVVDYFNKETVAFANARKLLIRVRLGVNDYDFKQQRYSLNFRKGQTCQPAAGEKFQTHNFCLSHPSLSGINSSPYRYLKMDEVQANATLGKYRPSQLYFFSECDTRDLKLTRNTFPLKADHMNNVIVGACPTSRFHVAVEDQENYGKTYKVIATFEPENTSVNRPVPVAPAKASIASESGLKKASPRQQQTLDIAK